MTKSIAVIEPPRGRPSLALAELWGYRELLFFLVWRDIKVRYKQTVLGVAWAVLQPLLAMVVFSLFFGRLAGMSSDGVPYPIFSYAALVPWTFFASGVTNAANSLTAGASLLKKVYFPRLTLPLAAILSGAVDFALAFVVLLLMVAYYGITPGVEVLWLAPLFLLACATALGAGLWLAAMNAQFRDVRYTLPFFIQLWMFVTPIVYSSSLVPDRLRPLLGLNPMAGVIDGFRWALLGVDTAPGMLIAVSLVVCIVLLGSGLVYFRSMERTFADTI